MKWKRSIFLLIIGGLLTLGILLIPRFNGTNRYVNYLHYLVWGNILNVSCDDILDKTKIKLIFENEFAIIENRDLLYAQKLLDRGKSYKVIRKVIFDNGKQVSDIPYDYGKQVIAVYYDNDKVGELRLWRTNHYHVHSYNVHVWPLQNEICVNSEIKGPDVNFYR